MRRQPPRFAPPGAAAPDQIYAYCGDEGEGVEPVEDLSAHDWYADVTVPLRADVFADLPQFDFNFDEDLDVVAELVYPDYWATGPPLDVWEPPEPSLVTEEPPENEDFGYYDSPPALPFVPDQIWENVEAEEPPEDVPFGFEIGPAPGDVWEPPEPSLVVEEPPEDEDFGFFDSPSPAAFFPDQIQESLEAEEPPEDQDYGFTADPLPLDVWEPPQPSLEQEEQPEDEPFGFDLAPLAPDFTPDQIDQELGNEVEEAREQAEQDYGFYDAPLADENLVGIQPSLEQEEEPDPEDFAFFDVPLAADFAPDQIEPSLVVEEPPEDEDFGFFDSPPAVSVFVPDQIWEELGNDGAVLDDNELLEQDYGFYDNPLPADVLDPPEPSLVVEEPPEDEDYGFFDVPPPDSIIPPYNPVPYIARYQEREYNRPRIPFPTFAGYISPPVVSYLFPTRTPLGAAYLRDYPYQQPTLAKVTASGSISPVILTPDLEFYEYVPKRTWVETIIARPWVEYIPKRRWSTIYLERPTVSIGPKDPVEVVVVSIDFTQELGSETIVTKSCAATTISGTDASPSAILSGSAGNTGGIVTQTVIGGVVGCQYEIKATITTSGGRTLVGATVLPIVVE